MDDPRRSPRRVEDRLAERGGAVELLRLPAALWRAASALRNSAYDRGLLPAARVDAPVVSVGNLTVGGTGKTPMVAWIVRELGRRGLRAGILSRGYGARDAAGRSDEARLLARLCPDAPHELDPDRVRGARRLVDRGVDAVVLDDGFQHRRLARDLDLVLVDACRPFGLAAPRGGGAPVRALLPRGLLREPPAGLARAHALVLTRVDRAAPAAVSALAAELGALAPGLPVIETAHRPRRLVDAAGTDLGLESLAGRSVDLLSGIGNPAAFEAQVEALGARVRSHRRFPDHHPYCAADLAGLGERWVVTTAKDAVKLPDVDAPVVVLEVELEVLRGGPVLEALLDALPPGRATRERRSLHEGLHG